MVLVVPRRWCHRRIVHRRQLAIVVGAGEQRQVLPWPAPTDTPRRQSTQSHSERLRSLPSWAPRRPSSRYAIPPNRSTVHVGSTSDQQPTQTLLVPAVISLIIFLFLTFVLVPVWRRYRNRYSQYLPLDSISDRTSSFRHRILGRFSSLNPLAHFVSGRQQVVFASGGAGTGAESGADDEDGEELGDVDEATWRAIERHVPSVHTPDSTRRLSREYAPTTSQPSIGTVSNVQ